MTDPVEALAAALRAYYVVDCVPAVRAALDARAILVALRASGFDVVPTGDTEPSESDPIETFSHPFRAPVVIDGHEYRHTSDCKWLASSDTGERG